MHLPDDHAAKLSWGTG